METIKAPKFGEITKQNRVAVQRDSYIRRDSFMRLFIVVFMVATIMNICYHIAK